MASLTAVQRSVVLFGLQQVKGSKYNNISGELAKAKKLVLLALDGSLGHAEKKLAGSPATSCVHPAKSDDGVSSLT